MGDYGVAIGMSSHAGVSRPWHVVLRRVVLWRPAGRIVDGGGILRTITAGEQRCNREPTADDRRVGRSLHGGLWRWLQDRLAVGAPLRRGRTLPHHRSPRLEMLEQRQLLSAMIIIDGHDPYPPRVEVSSSDIWGNADFSCTPTESDGINKAGFYVGLVQGFPPSPYPWCSSPVTVHYETVDGTAIAGEDYVAASGDLYFWPGETSKRDRGDDPWGRGHRGG